MRIFGYLLLCWSLYYPQFVFCLFFEPWYFHHKPISHPSTDLQSVCQLSDFKPYKSTVLISFTFLCFLSTVFVTPWSWSLRNCSQSNLPRWENFTQILLVLKQQGGRAPSPNYLFIPFVLWSRGDLVLRTLSGRISVSYTHLSVSADLTREIAVH